MALTDIQNEFLKLQLANNPEFQAAYFPNVITEGPSGPLYDVGHARSKPANVFYNRGAEFRNINVPYDTPGSRINIKATPRHRIDERGEFDRDYTTYAYMKPQELYHEGQPITSGQTQAINVAPWILKSYGTAPSSPRNEMVNTPDWWEKAGRDFGFETGPTVDQATLNDFIVSMLGHETAHGVSDKPGYTGTTAGAQSFDFTEFLSPNVKQGKAFLEGYDVNKMSPWERAGYEHAQEELYNRMKDIERLKIENPDDYEEHRLWDLYQNRAKMMYANLTGQTWRKNRRLYKFDAYQKKIKPYVDKYFEKVKDVSGGISDINIQKQKIGMPEHLTPPPKKTYTPPPRGGGADVMPIAVTTAKGPPSQLESRSAQKGDQPPRGGGPDVISRPKMYPSILTARRPHYPDPSPNRRVGRMPIGTDTRNPWGRADGGLMDIPLPGRSRYI